MLLFYSIRLCRLRLLSMMLLLFAEFLQTLVEMLPGQDCLALALERLGQILKTFEHALVLFLLKQLRLDFFDTLPGCSVYFNFDKVDHFTHVLDSLADFGQSQQCFTVNDRLWLDRDEEINRLLILLILCKELLVPFTLLCAHAGTTIFFDLFALKCDTFVLGRVV